ncbi:MAG: hypothetical protein WDA09_05285 [Bacteriovoracaceae bacterium]
MTLADGTGTGVEPDLTGAPDKDGKEQQGLGQPDGNQSTGEKTDDGKGTTSPSWMAQLPNDLKNEADLQQYATLADYVRSTREPKTDGSEGAGEEIVPLKYENFEKRLEADTDPFGVVTESLKTTLENSAIPKEVAEKVFDTLTEAQNGSIQQLLEKGKDWCEATLKKNWGDEYEVKRKAMSRAYLALVESDAALAKELDRSGASINPAVAELLARVGKSIEEDGTIPSNVSGASRTGSKVPVRYPD